jgi:glycosyltransferase involved in cell wall biosynthesis
MASSLSSFLRLSPEAREQMGRLGLALVEQKFTWTSIAQRLDEVYRWLVSGAPMPSCVELSS